MKIIEDDSYDKYKDRKSAERKYGMLLLQLSEPYSIYRKDEYYPRYYIKNGSKYFGRSVAFVRFNKMGIPFEAHVLKGDHAKKIINILKRFEKESKLKLKCKLWDWGHLPDQGEPTL